jgi:Ser/Thr protein kinase RdoA (MazF antagonist)
MARNYTGSNDLVQSGKCKGYLMSKNQSHDAEIPYAELTPDCVLNALESRGFETSGHMLALNSYENRVYMLGLEGGEFCVAKFYRPGRWSNEAILEEHAFSRELVEHEIPVVAPMADEHGNTLFEFDDYRFAVFPRKGGHAPDLTNMEHLEWLGRFLGRIHQAGRAERFEHRVTLSIQRLGTESREFILQANMVPDYLLEAYRTVSADLLARIETAFEIVGPVPALRIHGDFHPGNVLWTEQGPHFVDLDDCMNGPAIQDLWMLLSGEHSERQQQLEVIVRGYEMFAHFDVLQIQLIEALRGLRLLHYAQWLAKRWNDPAFPANFPWFNTPRYWEEHVNSLREQLSALDEPLLELNL